MPYMFVTAETSHFEISPLKSDLSLKVFDISETKLVYQFGIVPYGLPDAQVVHKPVTGCSVKHAATKVLKLAAGIHFVHTHVLAGPVTASLHENFG